MTISCICTDFEKQINDLLAVTMRALDLDDVMGHSFLIEAIKIRPSMTSISGHLHVWNTTK
jgi:hypothetical protein